MTVLQTTICSSEMETYFVNCLVAAIEENKHITDIFITVIAAFATAT